MLPSGSRRYIGIDPSLRSTGIAIIGPDEFYVTRSRPRGLRGARRLQYQRDQLRELLPGCHYACVEAPAIGATNRADDLGQIRGVFLLELLDQKVKTRMVEPTKLKKFATGRGDASKKKMILTATDMTGRADLNDDEADAFWLAYFGYALEEQPDTLKRHQLEAIYGISRSKKAKNKVFKPQHLNI